MFIDIKKYILKSKKERQSHLRLKQKCIKIGGYDSREYRGLLAHFLKTTIPTHCRVVLCHACNTKGCSNPRHLYWGTYSENMHDDFKNGTRKSFNEYMKQKYSASEYKRLIKKAASLGGKGNSKINKTQKHRNNISKSLKSKPVYAQWCAKSNSSAIE